MSNTRNEPVTIRFLHVSDVHLGYQQYGSETRFDDFFRAFDQVVDAACRPSPRTDFLLIAGDLFHKRTVDPVTLFRATQALIKLRNAGVPVLAIEGNHERPQTHDSVSWLEFLHAMGLLTLLTAEYVGGQWDISPWSADAGKGAYVDLPCGVRVYGLRYIGAATKNALAAISGWMAAQTGARPAYTVMMLHAGLEGVLDRYSAALPRADLEVLRPHCDYLALGHIHKPYTQDDWIYNPGSTETNSMEEVAWADRGYMEVTINPGAEPRHQARLVPVRRRPFLRLSHAVTTDTTPERLAESVRRLLDSQAAFVGAEAPVVELRLTGNLPFDRADLDLEALQRLIVERLAPAHTTVRDGTTPSEMPFEVDPSLPMAEMERQVLRGLLERDARFQGEGNAPRVERLANLVLGLKRSAILGADVELLLAELRAHRAAETAQGEGA
jgi:DNA repair exonuclease SbcCD nuclease subunit